MDTLTEKEFKDSQYGICNVKKISQILDENGVPFEAIYKIERDGIKYINPNWNTLCDWIWNRKRGND